MRLDSDQGNSGRASTPWNLITAQNREIVFLDGDPTATSLQLLLRECENVVTLRFCQSGFPRETFARCALRRSRGGAEHNILPSAHFVDRSQTFRVRRQLLLPNNFAGNLIKRPHGAVAPGSDEYQPARRHHGAVTV